MDDVGRVNGRKYTSRKNGNSIFLPAAVWRYGTSLNNAGEYGNYWSSTPYGSDTQNAYRLYGLSVRPVSEF